MFAVQLKPLEAFTLPIHSARFAGAWAAAHSSPLPASRKQPEPASTTLKYDHSGKDTKHSKCDPREDWEQVPFEYCPRKRGRRPMIEMVPGSGEYFQATVDGLSDTEIHVHFPGKEQGLTQHSWAAGPCMTSLAPFA